MFTKIVKVYSGKANSCMCGCSGKWSYTQVGAKESEYATVNERSVKLIANKVFKQDASWDAGAKCLHVDTGTRTLAVYFE